MGVKQVTKELLAAHYAQQVVNAAYTELNFFVADLQEAHGVGNLKHHCRHNMQDVADMLAISEYIRRKDFVMAYSIAASLDSFIKNELPDDVWEFLKTEWDEYQKKTDWEQDPLIDGHEL